MDTKESLIIKEAGKLLAKVGPLAMTMDAVAHNCGISKRTLYEVFPDKKSLIRQCLDMEHAKHDKELKEIFESSANCFEALFRTYKQIRLYLQGGAYKVGEEVARIYPDIFEDHAEKEKRIVRQLSGLLAKAQTEGHVVQAIDTDIASFLFLSSIRNINDSERIGEYGFDRIDVFDGAFINFLRGIATRSGIEFIDDNLAKFEK